MRNGSADLRYIFNGGLLRGLGGGGDAIDYGFDIISAAFGLWPRTYAQGSSEYLDDYECRQALKAG